MSKETRAHEGERERRVFPMGRGGVELRDEGESRGLRGTVNATGDVADLGHFTEEFEDGAFDEAVRESDIRGLFNHDPNFVLGRTGSGTMEVRAESRGLRYEIPDLPKSREDVREAVERQDVDGNSLSFTVLDERWEKKDGKPHRVIERVARIFDVGPVTFPAYPNTDVALRSMERAGIEPPEAEVRAMLDEPRSSLEWRETEEAEEVRWGDVDLSFEAFREGYYAHTGADRPDEEITRWDDAPQTLRDWAAARSFLGNPDADTFDDGVAYPAVNPSTDALNEGGLRAVSQRAGQEAGESISEETAEAIQGAAGRMLDEHFADEDDDERGEPTLEDVVTRVRELEERIESMERRVKIMKRRVDLRTG